MIELNELPSVKLTDAIATYGRELADDARRCEALLRDLCQQYPREINILVNAARDQVPRTLLSSNDYMPIGARLSILTKQLQNNQGLTQEAARWAVETWAVALGVASKGELEILRSQQVTDEPPAAPPPLPIPEPAPPLAEPSRASGIPRRFVVMLIALGMVVSGAGTYLYNDSKLQAQIATSTQSQTRLMSTVEAQQTAFAQTQATTEAQMAVAATTEAELRQQIASQATLIADSHGALIFNDDFSTTANGWFVGGEDDEYWLANRQIANGVYRWEVTSKQGFIAWSDYKKDVSDFYLTVESRQVSGQKGQGSYGVVFRLSQDANKHFQYYLLDISNDQRYQLRARYQNDWLPPLIPWTDTSAIRPNQVNRITVLAQGVNFRIYINDQFITEYSDNRLTTGQVGVVVGILEPGQTCTFEFDNFELREP